MNNEGLWAGSPGNLNLVARRGNSAPAHPRAWSSVTSTDLRSTMRVKWLLEARSWAAA